MSFFNEVYGDRELSARAKTVCLYLHDRANREGAVSYTHLDVYKRQPTAKSDMGKH